MAHIDIKGKVFCVFVSPCGSKCLICELSTVIALTDVSLDKHLMLGAP